MAYIRVRDPRGAEVREIKTDANGLYLGDLVQDFQQGSVLESNGECHARLSPATTSSSAIHKVKNNQQLSIGVDSNVVEVYSHGTLRIQSGLTSGQDVVVIISPSEENRISMGSFPMTVDLIAVRNRSAISLSLIILEINGSEYRVTNIAGLSGGSVAMFDAGSAISVSLDL